MSQLGPGCDGGSPESWGHREEANGLQSQEGTFFPRDSSIRLQPSPTAGYGKPGGRVRWQEAGGQIQNKEMAAKKGDPECGLSGQGQVLGSSHHAGQDTEVRTHRSQSPSCKIQIQKQKLESGSWTRTSVLLLRYHTGSVAR